MYQFLDSQGKIIGTMSDYVGKVELQMIAELLARRFTQHITVTMFGNFYFDCEP